jgi:hypothetical protein
VLSQGVRHSSKTGVNRGSQQDRKRCNGKSRIGAGAGAGAGAKGQGAGSGLGCDSEDGDRGAVIRILQPAVTRIPPADIRDIKNRYKWR